MNHNWSDMAANFASKAWESSTILPLSREFALNHLPQLGKQESIDFVAANMKRFDRHYNKALLLCCPELWLEWSIEDWMILGLRLSPRPSKRDFYNTGAFMDFVFLMRWVKVDALYMLRHSSYISSAEKLSILDYCWTYTPYFMNSATDSPIGWNSDVECYAMLHEAQQRLLRSCNSMQPSCQDLNEFLNEVRSLYKHFGGNSDAMNFER